MRNNFTNPFSYFFLSKGIAKQGKRTIGELERAFISLLEEIPSVLIIIEIKFFFKSFE